MLEKDINARLRYDGLFMLIKLCIYKNMFICYKICFAVHSSPHKKAIMNLTLLIH